MPETAFKYVDKMRKFALPSATSLINILSVEMPGYQGNNCVVQLLTRNGYLLIKSPLRMLLFIMSFGRLL